jgi:serine/threonine protein phosphatase PrpC
MSTALSPVTELFDIASRTHPGSVREVNEDHCATFYAEDCAGLIVADGVSSFNGGDTASRLAVETTQAAFLSQESSLPPAKRLYRAVQRANIAVHDLALTVPELRSMATTLTAVLLGPSGLYAAHVGDCRLYLLRANRLQQLSRDHTVAAERTRLGILSKARARHHPGRSTLTRSLGRELVARVDQFAALVAPDDVLMMCSDGIHNVLDDEELLHLCLAPTAEVACEQLVKVANQRGAPDNVTAAVARVSRAVPARPARRGLLGALNRRFGGR